VLNKKRSRRTPDGLTVYLSGLMKKVNVVAVHTQKQIHCSAESPCFPLPYPGGPPLASPLFERARELFMVNRPVTIVNWPELLPASTTVVCPAEIMRDADFNSGLALLRQEQGLARSARMDSALVGWLCMGPERLHRRITTEWRAHGAASRGTETSQSDMGESIITHPGPDWRRGHPWSLSSQEERDQLTIVS